MAYFSSNFLEGETESNVRIKETKLFTTSYFTVAYCCCHLRPLLLHLRFAPSCSSFYRRFLIIFCRDGTGYNCRTLTIACSTSSRFLREALLPNSSYKSPEQVHKYYKDDSILGRPGSEGTMSSVTTIKGIISDEIMSSNYIGCEPKIEAVNAQKSIIGSVIVGVTGSFTGKDKVKQNFTQTFFLAPQAGGFYVNNDFVQLMEINDPSTTFSVNSPTAPLRPDPGSSDWVLFNGPECLD